MGISEIIGAADNLKALLCPDQEIEDIREIRNKIAESLEKEENSLQVYLENHEIRSAKQVQYQTECREIEADMLKIREEKVFDKLTDEEYCYKDAISKYNEMNQDLLLRIEKLEQEVNRLNLSTIETPPDVNSTRLKLYRGFGISGLMDESGSFNRIQICPADSTDVHTIFLNDDSNSNQASAIANSQSLAQVNRLWAFLAKART